MKHAAGWCHLALCADTPPWTWAGVGAFKLLSEILQGRRVVWKYPPGVGIPSSCVHAHLLEGFTGEQADTA